MLADAERVASELAVATAAADGPYAALSSSLAAARAALADEKNPAAGALGAIDLAGFARTVASAPHAGELEGHRVWLQSALGSLEAYSPSSEPAVAAAKPTAATVQLDAVAVQPAAASAEPAAAAAKPAAASAAPDDVVELDPDDLIEEEPAPGQVEQEPAPGRVEQEPAPRVQACKVGDHVCARLPSGGTFLGFVRHLQEGQALVAFSNGYQQWFDPAQLEPPPASGEPVAVVDPEGQHAQGTLVAASAGRYQVALESGERRWVEWTVLQPLRR